MCLRVSLNGHICQMWTGYLYSEYPITGCVFSLPFDPLEFLLTISVHFSSLSTAFKSPSCKSSRIALDVQDLPTWPGNYLPTNSAWCCECCYQDLPQIIFLGSVRCTHRRTSASSPLTSGRNPMPLNSPVLNSVSPRQPLRLRYW